MTRTPPHTTFAPERRVRRVRLSVRYWIGTRSARRSVSGAVCNAWAGAGAAAARERGYVGSWQPCGVWAVWAACSEGALGRKGGG